MIHGLDGSRRSRLFALTLASLSLMLGGCADLDVADDDGAETPTRAASSALDPGEPADPGLPGGGCVVESDDTLEHGRLFRPGLSLDGECFAQNMPGGRPLFVFAYGNTYHHYDYQELSHHLAHHGFIVVTTFENGAGNIVSAVNEAMSAGLNTNGRLAVGGHSAGGEAAVSAAKAIRDAGMYDVDAVIGLAPRDIGGFHLTADASRGMLLLYGSHDEDICGRSVAPQAITPLTVKGTPFSLWDRSGLPNDLANPLTAKRNHLRKHLIYVEEARHIDFSDRDPGLPEVGEEPPVANGPEVKQLTLAYVHAYLRWFLKDDSAQEGFFEGPAFVPDSVEAGGLTTHLLSRGKRTPLLKSRVIDEFERPGAWDVSTIGGAVDADAQLLIDECWRAPSYQVGTDPMYPCPHDTDVANIVFAPSPGVTPHVSWQIPNHFRDFRPYTYLSFRVGVMYASMFNVDGASISFDVRLGDTGTGERTVQTSTYAEIPYPIHAEYVNVYDVDANWTKSHMVQVKIPLTAFSFGKNAVDLANVDEVRFVFPAGEGQIVIDDLELSF